MNTFAKTLLAASFVLTLSSQATAQPGQPITGPEQHCYAMSMVGYDSVINSRLGVPPEHALDLAAVQRVGGANATYQPYLLKVVLSAYLWDQSPHNYAVRVMYQCAQSDAKVQTADIADKDLM